MEQNQVVDGLRKRDNAAYNLLYTFYYPTIESFVKRNSGTSADAKDIFQETIIVLLDKVPKKDFILTSSIKTYIFAVASNLWLKRLRDAKKMTQLGTDFEMEDLTLAEWEQKEEAASARNSIQRVLHKISRHCLVFLTKTFLTGATREKLVEKWVTKIHRLSIIKNTSALNRHEKLFNKNGVIVKIRLVLNSISTNHHDHVTRC